jgi:hypothetical protein
MLLVILATLWGAVLKESRDTQGAKIFEVQPSRRQQSQQDSEEECERTMKLK